MFYSVTIFAGKKDRFDLLSSKMCLICCLPRCKCFFHIVFQKPLFSIMFFTGLDTNGIMTSPTFRLPLATVRILISPHSSVDRALDLKTRGCGFDSLAGQPNNY